MNQEETARYQEDMGSPEMEYLQYQTDFPEAETMETRRAMKKEWSGARVFWFLAFTLMFLMFFGNFIISLLQ